MKNITFSGVFALIAVAAIVGITFQPVVSLAVTAVDPAATVDAVQDSPVVTVGPASTADPVLDGPTITTGPVGPVNPILDPIVVVGTPTVGPSTTANPILDGPTTTAGPGGPVDPILDPVDPTPPAPTPSPSPSPSSGGNGGGSTGSGSVTTPLNQPQGQVLGAATACSPYLTAYLKRGVRNREAVKMLQTFLKEKEGADLPITGNFGALTFAAVKAFQAKHADEVLSPWGLHANQPTGYVFKTTLRKINNAQCPSLNLPIPAVR